MTLPSPLNSRRSQTAYLRSGRATVVEPAFGADLPAIRAQLRQLAEDNAEVGARLAVMLGLEAPAQ
jgi:hypothetical protein